MDHSMIVAGAGATTAGDTTIGNIELPQRDSGNWIIHHVFAQAVRATATAAESVGGHFRLSPTQGELTPQPAPSRFPVFSSGSFLGAVADVPTCPLNIYEVDYSATGQARIDMIYNQAITVTVAAQVVLGVVFGDKRPTKTPFKFVDRVRTTVTAAADTSIGTITLSQNAKRIVGIAGIIQQNGVLTTAEELIGFFRLDSDDVKLVPAQYPFNAAFGAGLGATIASGVQGMISFMPVDIAVPRGARIDCFSDLNTAVTNGADVEIFIAYE
jgi:hypothetical protein